ncbi:DUF3043 domain-containing protein [Rugosimonospora acidiphila]
MFRRKPVEEVAESVIDDEPEESLRSRSYTPKKGEATPKRVIAGRRPVAAAPANRKEALQRSREKQRQDREERRAGMMSGDERYLLARDRGPIRAIARDVIDSRRNVGTIFIFALVAILVASIQSMPSQVKAAANVLFIVMIVALILDTVLVVRRIRRLASERHPKATERWGSLYFYIVMRSISFRRMRVPKPRVKIGDQI